MPAKWYNATLLDYTDINSTTRNFIFRVAEDIQFTWKGGQFITLDLPVGSKRVDRWRSYSIASIPNSSHTFELCIVKNPQGLGTTYLFNQLRQGDEITFKGPEGSFVVAPSTPETEHIMICTGTGIAPCRSMIHEMYSMDIPFKNIHLIFGTRHSHGLLYKSEWEQRVKQDKRFIYDPILSREKRSDMASGYVHQVYQDMHHSLHDNRIFYICGWRAMVDQAVDILTNRYGYPIQNIKTELYG